MLIELVSKGNFRKEGNYQKLDVEYIREGKKQKKTLVAINKTKEVVKKIYQEINPGDSIEVELEKSEDGQYWNWVGVTKAEAPAAKSSYQTKNTYETPEERARKQVYIVKQSSIANALEFHKNDAKVTVDQVLETADAFVKYVFGELEAEKPSSPKPASTAVDADFEDDIPF
jgi:hypothetical protein